LVVHYLQKQMSDIAFGKRVADAAHKLQGKGRYDPYKDMILTPYNIGGCGSIMLNTMIAEYLDNDILDKQEALMMPYEERHKVYEVVSGFMKSYYAIGDRVYDGMAKMDGVITAIRKNGEYYGKLPQEASIDLSRHGTMRVGSASQAQLESQAGMFEVDDNATYDYSKLDLDSTTMTDAETRMVAASHTIEVTLQDGTDSVLSSAGAINSLGLGYCLTIHKSQGCEWPRVIIACHTKHTQLFREGLYTAITRAQKDCFILSDMEATVKKVMKRQRITGNSLDEKVANFNAKLNAKYAKAKALGGQQAADKLPQARLLDCIRKVDSGRLL